MQKKVKMKVQLQLSSDQNFSLLLSFVRSFHEFEGIVMDDLKREQAVKTLIGLSPLGRIWLIEASDKCVGYIVICFGYTIEFGGRDAFIDEFYIDAPYRGKGIGFEVLKLVRDKAEQLEVCVLHLEVAHTNARAQRLYHRAGFTSRERYFLMSQKISK